MQKINGEIYAMGVFDKIEGLGNSTLPLLTNIAKFDGEKWCIFSPPFNNIITGITQYKNDIYINGAFTQIGNDTVWGFVRWNGGHTTIACSPTISITMSTVGLTEQTLLENLSVYPNPVSDKLTVQFESKIPSFPTLVLTNTLGEVLLTVEKPGLIQQLDLSGLPKGLYFLKMNFSETQTTYKIVKE